MKNKNFEVKIYHTSFSTYQVKAKTKDDAIKKARRLPIKENEIFNHLESWQEADDAVEIKNYAKNNE